MVTISKFDVQNPRYVNHLKRKSSIPEEVEQTVKEVIHHVKEKGDEALYSYMKDYESVLPQITNAGAIFVGEYSTEPVGHYFCGTNHILPTCGTAKFSSGSRFRNL